MDASFNTQIIKDRTVYSNILTKQLMINQGTYESASRITVGSGGSNIVPLSQAIGSVFVTPTEFNAINGFFYQPPPIVALNYGSLLFQKSSVNFGYLTVPNSPDFSMGTGDFTIEWFQNLQNPNSYPRIFSLGSNSDAATMAVSIEDGIFYLWINSTPMFGIAVNVYNAWHHFAVVRRNGSINVYLNGVPIGAPLTNNSNMVDVIHNLTIGNESDPTYEASFTGYLTNFRIVKGEAVYLTNFTPPTSQLLAITGTVLLIVAAGQYPSRDMSGTNKVVTPYLVTWSMNSPF